MVLAYDSPQPAEERRCDHCGRSNLLVRAFITRDGDAYAIVFAACHVHDSEREAWIDVILGTFSSDDAPDHVTFGARVGPVAGQADPAATAVPAAAAYSQSPFWDIKLSRDEALAHPRIDEFWEIVDYVLLTDPVVHAHVYGHKLSTLARAGRSFVLAVPENGTNVIAACEDVGVGGRAGPEVPGWREGVADGKSLPGHSRRWDDEGGLQPCPPLPASLDP